MERTYRFFVFVAMILLTCVSMWTTYISLHDSILPEPVISIPFSETFTWDCSIFALALSMAIGMMLFALKIAIVDGQKRLNLPGILGLTVVAFISIAFNMDVLYRTADREFFLRYSDEQMRSVYENHLADIQATLLQKRDTIRTDLARQQGELEAEIEGLREAPSGYGRVAKNEDYKLTLLEKTTAVELQTIDDALAAKEKADALLLSRSNENLDDIQQMQSELRVLVKDAGAIAGLKLPPIEKMNSPFFAVFAKLFDLRNVGIKEVFFLILAFFLDIGDIIGYSLVPNKRNRRSKSDEDEYDDGQLMLKFPEKTPALHLLERKPNSNAMELLNPDEQLIEELIKDPMEEHFQESEEESATANFSNFNEM